MAKRIWTNAEVIWDADSAPQNPGWVVKVDEIDSDGHLQSMTFGVHPDYSYAGPDADTDEVLRATAKWESAEIK
jgi:hypothetical protein